MSFSHLSQDDLVGVAPDFELRLQRRRVLFPNKLT